MEHHLSLTVYTICYLGKRIVATTVTKTNFFVMNSIFLPTKIAFIYESSNACDFSAIERQKFNSHLNCDILKSKISTDEANAEFFFFFLIFFKWRSHLGHLFLIIFCSNPSFFIIWLAWRRRHFSFRFDWNRNPPIIIFFFSFIGFFFWID